MAYDPGRASQACMAELGDLSRAGPDPSCVRRCEHSGVPAEAIAWLDTSSPMMGTH